MVDERCDFAAAAFLLISWTPIQSFNTSFWEVLSIFFQNWKILARADKIKKLLIFFFLPLLCTCDEYCWIEDHNQLQGERELMLD